MQGINAEPLTPKPPVNDLIRYFFERGSFDGNQDASEITSRRICYYVGTYLLLHRDVIFISSVDYDSSSHQPFRKEAVTNQIASRSLAYQLLIYQCL